LLLQSHWEHPPVLVWAGFFEQGVVVVDDEATVEATERDRLHLGHGRFGGGTVVEVVQGGLELVDVTTVEEDITLVRVDITELLMEVLPVDDGYGGTEFEVERTVLVVTVEEDMTLECVDVQLVQLVLEDDGYGVTETDFEQGRGCGGLGGRCGWEYGEEAALPTSYTPSITNPTRLLVPNIFTLWWLKLNGG
jgi:hypothetical protein